MQSKTPIWFIISCLLLVNVLGAQPVLYAPVAGSSSNTDFEVVGKAENYYWIHKRKKSSYHKNTPQRLRSKDFAFALYDARLNWLKEIQYQISDSTIKEYLVAGNRYFDQLLFNRTADSVGVFLTRFTADGVIASADIKLACFPGYLDKNDFLLIRSQDKSKMLLLAFEPVAEAPPRLHVILYDNNWKVLFRKAYTDGKLAQPLLQLDFTSYPLEHFDYSPVKVANNGDWLMIAPARRADYYLLTHFQNSDSTIVHHEIKQPQGPAVQNFCLSLDENTAQAIAGMLISVGSSAAKKVRMAHYNLFERRIDFDTTYRFSTAYRSGAKEAYLFEQHFIPVETSGFLYFKEYGKTFLYSSINEAVNGSDEKAEQQNMPGNGASTPVNKNGYIRYNQLFAGKRNFERGDLLLNYLPANKSDSCWSGLLNITQAGALNPSYLSYVCMPFKSKIIFLYNNLAYNFNKIGSTTTLDQNGNALNEERLFWATGNIMNFQRTRQIGIKELAVPYEKNKLHGFAVIRL